MRTQSQSCEKFPQQEASPAIVEPLHIKNPFLEDQFPKMLLPKIHQKFRWLMIELWQNCSEHPLRVMRTQSACPHHGFFELHQLDTFYNALNVNDQDSLNSAAGGNFFDQMPRECLKIIESKSKVRQTRAKAVVAKVSTSSSTPAISSDVAELKDMVRALLLDKKNQSSTPVSSPTPVKAVNQPPAYQAPAYQAPIPQTQSVSKTDFESYVKASDAVLKNMQNQDMSFEISFTDALILMPKFASTLKALIGNKEKLSEMARTPMNEHCSAVILNKLPRKLGDPSKFLIPCEFPGMDECLALADLDASINLMPLSVWEGLSLSKLTLTCMTLKLADRSVSKPIGIAKDVLVKVGVFHFPADFVVVDFEPDPRVSLILGRCFLKTGRALIDVNKAELTLRIENEAITYNLNQTSRYSANYNQMTANKLHVICEMYSQEVLGFSNTTASGNPTPYDDPIVFITSPTLTLFGDSDFLLFEEADAFLGPEDDPNLQIPKTVKSSVDEPPEVELKDLPPHLEYTFLEGDKKFPVIIAKELGDEEKSALIKDYKPAVQHQRRVNPKIYDVIKKEVEKLLDAGLIYPNSDSPWVSHVHCVPKKVVLLSLRMRKMKEPIHTVEDLGMRQDQEFVTGDNDEQPADKEVTKSTGLRNPSDLQLLIPNGTKDNKWTSDLLRPRSVKLLDVYSRKRIIAVTRLMIMKKYDYGHLEEIEVCREDQNLYKFREGNFPRLRLQDIEDILLLLVQQKLTNLTIDERNKTTYTAYSDPKGVIYKNQMNRSRLMRADELHKFNDDTLDDVRSALNDIVTGIRMECLPKRKWSNLEK
uniref:Reverse transcriptase domain-containing protein n=1 Tax=Tanacetum cinerariifolium TaxID=118510 RepID=A0A699HT13_TANCI|nr:reverse transcriptase domain-containing protein [Tanacetum cinerariifolium]